MASVLPSAIIESVTPATSTTKSAAMEMLKAGNSGNVDNSGYLCDMDGPEKSIAAEITKSITTVVKTAAIAKSIVKSIAKSIVTINVAAITQTVVLESTLRHSYCYNLCCCVHGALIRTLRKGTWSTQCQAHCQA